MVGTRQVHVARQSWRRQPGTEALKAQGTFTKTCPDASRDFPAEGLQAMSSWSATPGLPARTDSMFRLDADSIIDGLADPLLEAKVSFSCLHRHMAEQKA